jgi:hypothetical protein
VDGISVLALPWMAVGEPPVAAHGRKRRCGQTLGKGGVLRVHGIHKNGRCRWPAASAEDGGGPADGAGSTRARREPPEAEGTSAHE